ncbi:MAG: hypothetical protein L0H31_10405 [Nocardioidaceae bacterium]|nr:hypothetical protein [Nocardioidaceae bacterium]
MAALSLAACSGATDGDGSTGASSSVDPQVFDDVLAAYLPVPGDGARRGLVVLWFERGVGLKECGGAPPEDKYAYRLDQTHYPDLDLITEDGFGDYSPDERTDYGPNPEKCTELGSDKLPSAGAMHALGYEWNEKTLALDNGELAQTLADVGACLSKVVGVSLPKPVINYYFDHVDGARSKDRVQFLTDEYLRCTPPYFDPLRKALLEIRPDWVERHREALESFASELTAAGYVP